MVTATATATATVAAQDLLGGGEVATMAAARLELQQRNGGDRKVGGDSNSIGAGFAWRKRRRGGDNVGSEAVMVTAKQRRQARRRRRQQW